MTRIALVAVQGGWSGDDRLELIDAATVEQRSQRQRCPPRWAQSWSGSLGSSSRSVRAGPVKLCGGWSSTNLLQRRVESDGRSGPHRELLDCLIFMLTMARKFSAAIEET